MDTLDSAIEIINRAGASHWEFSSAMFVQVAALVAILALVELCLKRRVRAVVRYWIWALVVLKLLLPVTLRTPASVAYWTMNERTPVANKAFSSPAPSSTPTVLAASKADSERIEPPEELEFAARPSSPVAAHVVHSPVAVTGEARADVAVRRPLTTCGWLFLAWCAGGLVLGAVVLGRMVRVHRLVQRAGEAPWDLEPPLQLASELLDLPARQIRLRISAEIGCPAVCGFFRPTILFPQRLLGQLDEEQLQLVFVHELAHWKRWDLQLNLLQTVLQIVYFYNPAVWYANAIMRRLREEAVDDAVLVVLAAPAERYSQTLLEVAAQTLRPVEAGVPLIGILESRKSLVRRIYRMAMQPLPRSARLGIGGVFAVGLIGVALLPMAGGRRDTSEAEAAQAHADAVKRLGALRGRITDKAGRPLGDVRIQLVPNGSGHVREVRTSADGRYSFQPPVKSDTYSILIDSDGYVGLTDPHDALPVVLDAAHSIVRNFALPKECRLRVQTVDEGGRPVAGVNFITARSAKIDPRGTGRDGWVTIGGLRPTGYVFATRHDDSPATQFEVTLKSADEIVERRVVLKTGTSVKGKLFTWDGKPAAGWQVVAVPDWWAFAERPRAQAVDRDGSFVLPHVGPGKYNVSLVIPAGGNSFSMPLASGVDLFKRSEPLALRADIPSPGWQCSIEGKVQFSGKRDRRGIRVFAQSLENDRYRDASWVGGSDGAFRIGPVPPGRYRLTFEDPGIETKVVTVVAPTAGLKVEIECYAPIPIHGVVSVAGAKGLEPVGDFRIRIFRRHDPLGTKFASQRMWRPFNNSEGAFSDTLPGPGIYIVEAAADGYAKTQSNPINAAQLPKEGIRLTLLKTVRLTGMVVDETGRPIDGAIITSLAKSDGHMRGPTATPLDGTFATTAGGRFAFDGLAPGVDTFRIDHGEYVSSVVEKLKLPRDGDQPLRIVMKHGGTVCGHVLDDNGQPVRGVKLNLRRTQGTFAGDLDLRDLGRVTTDALGYYEIHALPEQPVQIWKSGGENGPRGVFFRCVVPSRSQIRMVDFGGPSTVSGRLFFDGRPLVRTLMLADEDFGSGSFAAKTDPASDGSFAFSGVPLGKHVLFVSGMRPGEWIRIRDVEIHSAEQSLGRIDFGGARLTVNVAGTLNRQNQEDVYLHDYNPTPFLRRFVARANFPHRSGQEFVFDPVGFGKYDIVATAGPVRLSQMIEITPNDLKPAVTITWPAGTASLEGSVDPKLAKKPSVTFVQLANQDQRWSELFELPEGGHFRFAGIPAGRYSLSLMPLRLTTFVPVQVAEITFREGEARTLDITKAAIPPGEFTKGVLAVDAYTSDGVPLTGAEITLTGAGGPIKPQLSRSHLCFFAAPTGAYQLRAAYAGVKTVTQAVEIQPVLENAAWHAPDQVVKVTLARDH